MFHFVLGTVEKRKIHSIGWHRLRTRLFDDDDSPYIEWRVLKSVVEQLNTYYDRHGRFPDTYTELISTPKPNGTLLYAPDKSDHHIHDLTIEDGEVIVVVNAPDTLTPDSHYDWTETVNPWGTSRHCPRCGERGRTVKAPDDHTECRHGGHFYCSACGYECHRDVVGAMNAGRKHLDSSKMEEANPAAYTEAGSHAGLPSLSRGARSTGVQSTTDQQDQASGRQTRLF